MLKIGIIGLGDIALKAYLPVIGKRRIELHLHTRNEATLTQVGELYRLNNLHQSLDTLISSGITGAFVHAPTTSHYTIVEQLLSNNIHVYVDKPITYDFTSSEKLVALAERKKLILMVGFNRRYAPAYLRLKELKDPNMIIMQKNRKSLPGDIRTFIFDDFIHVVDTLLFLFPHPVDKLTVTGKKKDGLLYHVVIQLTSATGATAIGIMNRDSGTVEERLEVFTSQEKRVVYNVSDTIVHQERNETRQGTGDWDRLLYRRGFEQIVEDFLLSVESGHLSDTSQTLLTHKVCEEVVQQLELI
jgi:virulence factor